MWAKYPQGFPVSTDSRPPCKQNKVESYAPRAGSARTFPSGETKKNSHEPKINSVSRRGPQKARPPGTYFRGRVTKKGSSLRGGPKAPWTRNTNATKVTGTAQPRSTLQERTASVSTGDSKQLLLAVQHLSRTVQSNGQKFLLKKCFKALPLIMHEMKTTKIIRTKSK